MKRETREILSSVEDILAEQKAIPGRVMTTKEVRVLDHGIKSHRLIVEMVCTSMFGGVGIRLYTHPDFPGLPPTSLGLLTEKEFPGVRQGATLGMCDDKAYHMFHAWASTDDNLRWVKEYKLEPPKDLASYDY